MKSKNRKSKKGDLKRSIGHHGAWQSIRSDSFSLEFEVNPKDLFIVLSDAIIDGEPLCPVPDTLYYVLTTYGIRVVLETCVSCSDLLL